MRYANDISSYTILPIRLVVLYHVYIYLRKST